MRGGNLSGHSRRVADLCRRLSAKLQIDSKLAQEIFVAALLHEIGKVGFSDELLQTPVASMTPVQLDAYRKHTVQAEQLLMPLPDLRGATEIITAQFERFDGTGFPTKAAGGAIPVGARILALASDFDSLQIGTLAPRPITPDEAKIIIVHSSGKRYDPEVVDAFVHLLGGSDKAESEKQGLEERQVTSGEMEAGMVLTRDLVTPNGLLMLAADHALDNRLIQKIKDFEKSLEIRITAYISKAENFKL
jgi:response regulator RpfG family c-di-GMP phosphodiesterase